MNCPQLHCTHWRAPDYYSTRPPDHHSRSHGRSQTYGIESISPTEQVKSDQDSSNSRRRIQVACARCRKRKIKCSGPTGSIGTCQNCKSSGIDPKQCQFHRVSSRSLDDSWDLQAEGQALEDYSKGSPATINHISSGLYSGLDSRQRESSSSEHSNWQSTTPIVMEPSTNSTTQAEPRNTEMPFGYNPSGIDQLSRQISCCPNGYSNPTGFPSSQASFHQPPLSRTMAWPAQSMYSTDNSLPLPNPSTSNTNSVLENRQLPMPTSRTKIGSSTDDSILGSNINSWRDTSVWNNSSFAHSDFNGMHADSCPAAQPARGTPSANSMSNGATNWMTSSQVGAGVSNFTSGNMGPPAPRFSTDSSGVTAGNRRASHDATLRPNASTESTRSYSVPNNQHLQRSASDYNLYSFGNDSFYNLSQETPTPLLSNLRSHSIQGNDAQNSHSSARRPGSNLGSMPRANMVPEQQQYH